MTINYIALVFIVIGGNLIANVIEQYLKDRAEIKQKYRQNMMAFETQFGKEVGNALFKDLKKNNLIGKDGFPVVTSKEDMEHTERLFKKHTGQSLAQLTAGTGNNGLSHGAILAYHIMSGGDCSKCPAFGTLCKIGKVEKKDIN